MATKEDPDKIYAYSAAAHNALCQQKPWASECGNSPCILIMQLTSLRSPKYFKNVKISANALIKMVRVARALGAAELTL